MAAATFLESFPGDTVNLDFDLISVLMEEPAFSVTGLPFSHA